jgi:two-component system chemotaxis response regulator CheB
MIKVLIADDSAVVREYLSYILKSDPAISVSGLAQDGEEAVKLVRVLKPDIVVMDIEMPKMNGFEATREIMETTPLPIIIVTSLWETGQVEKTFNAMEAGALGIMEKPKGFGNPEYTETAEKLVETVKMMSEVRVIKRSSRMRSQNLPVIENKVSELVNRQKNIDLVAIGASTGGPVALKTILSQLPEDFVPILVVQHISHGFINGLVDWLNESTALNVLIASQNQEITRGKVYLAPDDCQMKVIGNKIILTKDSQEYSVRPSVSYLFRSVASHFPGRAVGILLTGMGKDGARELRTMRENGCITIAQNMESSVVHGMPGEAINIEAAEYILDLNNIAPGLVSLVNRGKI